jgi:hypothetical protein
MELKVEDYIDRRRDPAWEKELVQKLRLLPEEQRFSFIQALFHGNNSVIAMELIKKCIQDRVLLLAFLEQGLSTSDASSIRWWLELLVPKLGFRRVISVLENKLENEPRTVEKALYWLPSVLPNNDQKAAALDKKALKELVDKYECISSQIDKRPRQAGFSFDLALGIIAVSAVSVVASLFVHSLV